LVAKHEFNKKVQNPRIRSIVRINTNRWKVHRCGHGECGDDVAGKSSQKTMQDNTEWNGWLT
jgi:hypothetical protein